MTRILTTILILIFILNIKGYSQAATDSIVAKDSVLIKDSVINQQLKTDSIIPDSLVKPKITRPKTYQEKIKNLLSQNKFLHASGPPKFFITEKRDTQGKEYLFYLLSSILFVFGMFKLFYAGYFNNIFRVFFNTSLRQNQLTDLLLQARLPSLIFNIFFAIAAGLYVWLLLNYYFSIGKNYSLLILSVVSVSLIYFVKFCVLKFIGWITGMTSSINTYIFVIFLINKIIGVTLIPFIIFLAFAPAAFLNTTIIISLIVLAVFFLMRFFRSYSLLQHELCLSRAHFILYIIGVEIIPMLILYKLFLRFLIKI